jgi:hypothetical protein
VKFIKLMCVTKDVQKSRCFRKKYTKPGPKCVYLR